MTFIAYTLCDNGFRFFADLSGVCVSYDPKLIKMIIAQRSEAIQHNQKNTEEMEKQLLDVTGEVPSIITHIMEFNKKVIKAQVTEHKRTGVAEASINDQLVRDVMCFDDVMAAVNYTRGTHNREESE